MKSKENLIVALIPNYNDLRIAKNSHWYRIPVATKIVPQIIKNKSLEYLAFYQPKKFKAEAFSVRYFAKVKDIRLVKRKELLPEEIPNPKSENEYYQIIIDNLKILDKPIYSLRKRRILFIKSNYDKFINANEINDLFLGSHLEEKFWHGMKINGLNCEREYFIKIEKNRFYLDFAIFCRNRKLAVECDGDAYHSSKENVKNDKKRDNALESKGWHVLRYTTDDIEYNLESSILQVKEAINTYGGIEEITEDISYKILPTNPSQDSLF